MSTARLMMAASALAALAVAMPAAAQKKYDTGASDKEIVFGHTNPYSGPASAYGTIGKAIEAYVAKVNDEGGVNGRKLRLITYDDGYSPPKTVEMVRRLVEQDEVLFLFNTLGTPTNTAIHKYMNGKKVPQLFVATGATKWGDPKNFPWTMGWQPNYQTEAKIYAEYILKNKPDAKIGVLYQNDDYGKDYLHGFEEGLGEKGRKLIVSKLSYEVTDPTIDSQIVSLKGAGADVFFNITTPKFAAQAIRKAADIDWKPLHFLNSVSASVGSVLEPAGLDKSVGIISTFYLRDPTDPQWQKTKEYQDWAAWMDKYYPAGDKKDPFNVFGYSVTQTLVHVLKQCGDNLTRENVMKQAASIKGLELPMLLPGIKVNTGPDDYYPIEQEQLAKFNGKSWELFGEILGNRGS
jgi:branched-chain amino acid transport system substrate-binding protein